MFQTCDYKEGCFYPGISIIEMTILDAALCIGNETHAEEDNNFFLFLFSDCNLHFVMICIFSDIFMFKRRI